MLMEKTHYLPHEELKPTNFPEVVQMANEIAMLQAFSQRVDMAVYEYNQAIVNKIDLDIVEVKKYIELCRTVCEVLGNAKNVCFDILMDIRQLQMNFQEIVYAKTAFGSEYVGTPTEEVDEDVDGGYEF